jgi:hypothetical protein
MTEEKLPPESNAASVAHKDPALIPTAIYNAEGKMATVTPSMFITTAALDEVFPNTAKDQLVAKMELLAETVSQVRTEITAQTNRRNNVVGKGFRNYGFMLAANQSINNFPELAPNFIDVESFNDVVEDYLFMRDVSERMLSIANDVRDLMNTFGNMGYDFALAYYANVRTVAERTRDKTAISVFNILRRFFTKRRTPETGREPSEKQLERDIHALLHGHKDGEVVIKNENPTLSGKVHEVFDDTHSPRTHDGLKESIDKKLSD